ncbi:MAG: hypothetical protein PHU64_06965 [Candidatus Omnitrophica bacterium]|nr:hypothetical protein [Candidatus Omnitrophota bacterium]MDD5430481.1 hypothetical protein [Candidatus Omnitrophota bacterium]
MKEKRKRRFLRLETVNRFKFINWVLFLAVASMFVNAYVSMKMIEEGKILFGGEFRFISFQVNFIGIIVILLIAIAFILHYSCGALSRMERILEEVLDGDYSLRIRLRKGDMMAPFAQRVNKVLELLDKSKKSG